MACKETLLIALTLALGACAPDTATPTASGTSTAAPGAKGMTPTSTVTGPMTVGGAAGGVATVPVVKPPAMTPVPMTVPLVTPPPAMMMPTVPAGAPLPGAGMMGAIPPAMMKPTEVMPLPMGTGDAPKIPEIKGDCPEFKNGSTIMVAGHKSIVIQVGAPGKSGPLLFYWHGTGSSAAEAAMFPGNSEIVSLGGIVAAFNGNQSSGKGADCSGTGAHNMADFDAADQIAACAVKSMQVDGRRIYSTGCSAGGLQTGCMGMVRSSYLAAVAPNSGGVVSPQPWQDMHTPAVLTMHGGSSDMVIVTFSQTSATFDMAAKSHGGIVVNCDHGGGHCQAPADLQKSAWQFMKDHPFGTKTSPWATAFPAGTPMYCKML